MKRFLAINLGLGCWRCPRSAPAPGAQTIYPLDRAEILAGARFDLKVEFPGAPARGAT